GLTFSKNVLSVIEAWKMNEEGMTEITGDETITGTGVMFTGVDATDAVLCRVAYDVDEPIVYY
ncbi:MAG: hypothetical protein PHF25_06720, partial [Candidatus Margulisbacteria bacterium]|nr:hypothetical protein [Candidatus Margulisiibacteriota bacterium]